MAKSKKKSRKSKKSNKPLVKLPDDEPKELKTAPHTFVIHRGMSSPLVIQLSRDFRRMMEPFTASNLQEKKTNKMRDFVHLSGIFHVSHMCLFSLSEQCSLSMKIVRMPKGPTLSFKVHQFTLAKDVISSTKKQFVDEDSFKSAPLVILNSFSGEGRHLKLMASTFQNMFPPINLSTVRLSKLKRCVLLSYNPISKLIDLRHFSITVVPVNLNKGVKKVVTRKIPNLAKFDDISDFVEKGHLLSESEIDDEETHVILPQTLNKGNLEDNKSSLRLHEIGPRITMRLMKIEDDLLNGEVLYHDYIVKDALEVEKQKKKRDEKNRLKELRKKKQEENVQKKENDKLEHKVKTGKVTDTDKQLLKDAEEAVGEVSDEDDAEYYQEEIGDKPEQELFDGKTSSRKRPFLPKGFKMKFAKKRKMEDGGEGGKSNQKKNKKNEDDKDKKFKGKKLYNSKGSNKGGSFKNAKGKGNMGKKKRN